MNEGEKTCFSVNAIPTCRYPYKPQGGAYKEIDFYCVSRNSEEARHFEKLIKKGASPSQLSTKKANGQFKVNIPEYCVA